jgi:uncharacterized protein (DUF2252 family)
MAATSTMAADGPARGRAVRREVSRRSHAVWSPPPDRHDPVSILERQAVTRVPELVPLRHGRMRTSPFAFYRGGAALMAADLAGLPSTGLDVQLCGDAHLDNFGVFAAPDQRLVFSVDDFDETLPGPFEWDVKRYAASLAVAGRDREFRRRDREAIVLAAIGAYRAAIREFAGMSAIDVWYARMEVESLPVLFGDNAQGKRRRRFDASVAKARSKDSVRALDKLTDVVGGERRIIADPPKVVPIEDVAGIDEGERVEAAIRAVLRSYRRTLNYDRRKLLERFRYGHAARKVVGVGSVGTRVWILLLLGHGDDHPLFLQFKEAEPSVLEPYLGGSEFSNHGRRVVEGQRLMQSTSDVMLGWIRLAGIDGAERDFYVRQMWNGKGTADTATMEPRDMTIYARACGWTLARAHARSGDAAAIAGYLGTGDPFDRAMAEFAETYADQNELDYAAFQNAIASGRLEAVDEA